MLPFLIFTNPRMAPALLKHRYDMLDKARARANELGHRGAHSLGEPSMATKPPPIMQLEPRSITSTPTRKYVEVTGDEEFLWRYGAAILIETARLWCVSSQSARMGAFASTASLGLTSIPCS